MSTCILCPRHCNAVRNSMSGDGFCQMGTTPVVARAAAHFWEEPCISGTHGSGTVFFSGCSLGCVFCQNAPISHHHLGQKMPPHQLAQLFERVEALGVHNLNLVNPTHFAPAILEALAIYKPHIPIVWNSSGYETTEMIAECRGLVDIFLPDFKYADTASAQLLADAPDYFIAALQALQAMCAQAGSAQYDKDNLMQSGVLVRHLVMPLRIRETFTILDTIASHLPEGTPVSLMRQYTPMNGVDIPGLDRRLTLREYTRAKEHMLSLGLPGYFQQKDAADNAYIPAFMDDQSTLSFPDTEA